MKIKHPLVQYVKDNYIKLPKSSFNEKSLIIVKTIEDSEHGYGHHSYSGFGIDKNGNIYWYYSSGCSCDGIAGVENVNDKCKKTGKILEVNGEVLPTEMPSEEEFEQMKVSFSDYA